MEITNETIIWYPGVYHGRDTGGYGAFVKDTEYSRLETLVIERAEQDGEWAIANGLVGKNNENEPKMRRMMAFVSDPKNIEQCLGHIVNEGMEGVRTVDWVCRDLANASRFAANRNRPSEG